MKKSVRAQTLLLFLLLLTGCKMSDEAMSERFLEDMKNGEFREAKAMLSENEKKGLDVEGIDFRLKKAHDLLEEFGIPPREKWEVSYDTGQEKGIFRAVIITIPVYKGNEPLPDGDLRYANIKLTYLYDMSYFDGSIFGFDTEIQMKRTGIY